MDLLEWLDRQDPDTIPYRPNVAHTGGFGLRTHTVGSPAHLGNDRGATPAHIVMPFREGYAEWRDLGENTPWGSFLRITPIEETPVELQIAHTLPTDTPHTQSWSGRYHQGDTLPARAADIGLSTGAHTHTELIVGFDEQALAQLRAFSSVEIIHDTAINIRYLTRHCADHGLNFDTVHERLTEQIETWGIREMTDIYAVREGLPGYRRPRWGDTATIHVDPYWALKI